MSRITFQKWRSTLTDRRLFLKTRLRVLECYVWSILLYGSETWTLSVAMMNRIEAFEMWCYRKMLKIEWSTHTSNEEVLRLMGRDRNLLNIVKQRKLEYFGHIIRGPKYHLLWLIIYSKIEGRRWIGRKKLSWLRNIRNWTNLSVEEIFRTAADRAAYGQIVNMVIANV